MHISRARVPIHKWKRQKREAKKSTLPSKLNLSKRGLSMRAARRCALLAHRRRFFLSLLWYAAWRWDSHACQFIYIYIYFFLFLFLVPPVLCRQSWKFNHRVRVREYEECITGTGASKAAFPGYDARCVRREQWEMNLSLVSRMEILNCGNAARCRKTPKEWINNYSFAKIYCTYFTKAVAINLQDIIINYCRYSDLLMYYSLLMCFILAIYILSLSHISWKSCYYYLGLLHCMNKYLIIKY